MQSIHVFHLAGGLITSHRAVRDDLETMMQIGLWPPTPTSAERAAADAPAGGRGADGDALDRPPGRS